jgi:hypothetical protein
MDVPAPSGRRDNGLHSADWGALVDLDPRLSEALLHSLASADVPAFVEPAGGLNAYTRAAQLPDRPLHRLWVDPSKADTARSVVAKEVSDLSALLAEREPGATAHGFVQAVPRSAAARVLRPPLLPDPPGRAAEPPPAAPRPAEAPQDGPAPEADDTDAVWRQIVADFGKGSDSPVPPWPVSEDVEPRRPRLRPARPEPPGDEPPAGGAPTRAPSPSRRCPTGSSPRRSRTTATTSRRRPRPSPGSPRASSQRRCRCWPGSCS